MTHDRIDSPSPWITRFAPLIRPGGSVLDIACGTGRHCRSFLNRGHPVTALDRDVSRILPAPGLSAIAADLEDGSPWPLPGAAFAGIVIANYLWRPLFSIVPQVLEPNGIVLVETFAAGNEAYGRPRNPDFLLQRGELLDLTRGLTVIAYEDGIVDTAKVVQRICAIKKDGPAPLP